MHILRERLARLMLPAPVAAIAIASESVAPLAGRNLALLPGEEGAIPDVPCSIGCARLGDDAVHLSAPVPIIGPSEPRPGIRPRCVHRTADRKRPLPVSPRPLWLLREPQPLAAPRSATVGAARRTERIESGWWDGRDVRRDYFVAQSPKGETVWIYRDHRYGPTTANGSCTASSPERVP